MEVTDEEDANETTMINRNKSEKSEKSIVEEKNKDSSTDLALIRTYLACERTFMASTRTNAIFAGLSLLLTNNNKYIPAMIILVLCIVVNIFSTYLFYYLSYKNEHLKNIKSKMLHLASPIFYSILLVVILIILLYVTVEGYRNRN
eukprot:47895_1